MKSLKTIVYTVLILVLGMTVTSVEAAPGDPITPLLHPGNMPQPLSRLSIGDLDNPGYGINVSGSGSALSQFPKPGSMFMVLNNLLISGMTWIGDKNSGFKVANPNNAFEDISLLPLSQRLNVDGSIMATSLKNTGTNKNLCSFRHTLIPCEGQPSYSWYTSNWGSCTSGTQTRTVECRSNIGTVVSDGQCTATKPAVSQSCVSSCQAPVLTAGDVSVSQDPTITSGANGIVNVDFDESAYENVSLRVSGPTTSTSAQTDVSPVSHGNFGPITWNASITAICKSTGATVTSNSIQITGTAAVSNTSSCSPIWVDGSPFNWKGASYGYFNQSKVSINPTTNLQDACYGYYVSGSDNTWYRYECVSNGNPLGVNPYYKYQVNGGGSPGSVIYTNASGDPYNPPTNNTPSYSTVGSPESWISGPSFYSRFVPIAPACS